MSKLLTKLKHKLVSPNVIRFSHEWTIEKFASYLTGNHAWKWPLYSECISPPENAQLMQMYFCLHPNRLLNHQYCLSIGILLANQLKHEIKLQCEIEILDQNHKVCYAKKGKFKLMQDECTQTVDNFIKHSDLLNSRAAYLQNDKLRLRFEIKLLARNDSFTNMQNIGYLPVGESRISEAAQVTHLEYKWTIRNCDCLFKVDDASGSDQKKPIAPLFIQSNYLSDNPQSDQHKLKLKLYLKGLNYDESEEFVDIKLCTDSLKMNFMVCAKIEFVGTGKGPQETIGLIYHGKAIRCQNNITQKDLMHLIESQSEKHFTINCEFTYMTCEEMHHDSGFKEENAKNDLEYQLDAAKTLTCYTKRTYDNIKFTDGLQQLENWKLEQFSLEMDNQALSLDVQWIENVNWFSVRLTLKVNDCHVTAVHGTIQFCISLLDQFGQKCYTKEMQVNALSSKESFGYGRYIRKAHLAHLLSNGKQITKLLIEFWVNTKMHNSSSDNVEYIFKYPTQNGSITNIITLNNSIYNQNSNFNVNGAVSLTQTAETLKRTPLSTVNFEK